MILRRHSQSASPNEYWWSQLTAPDNSQLPGVVSQQIDWYEKNAPYQRKMYYVAEIAVIMLSAAIPAATALGAGTDTAAVLGALVVVVGGLRHLCRWGENWIRSSKTLVDLRSEVVKWSQGAAPYESSKGTSELLVRIEAIVAG